MYKVKTNTKPNKLAGAIAEAIRENGTVELQSIGPRAVNQAIKGLIIARTFLREDEIELQLAPNFETIDIDGKEGTGIKIVAVGLKGTGDGTEI